MDHDDANLALLIKVFFIKNCSFVYNITYSVIIFIPIRLEELADSN